MAARVCGSSENDGDHSDFKEDEIPYNTFQLQGDIFLSCVLYEEEEILIHVRKYHKYRGRYYASKEGVTFTPHQFANVVSNNYLQQKIMDIFPTFDTSVSIRDKIKKNIVLSIEFTDGVNLMKETTNKRGEKSVYSVTLNNEQWNRVFELREITMHLVCNLLYQNISLQKLFEKISGITVSKEGLDFSIMHELCVIFRQEIYKALAEQNLLNPYQVNSLELCNNTLLHFNCAAINLNVFNIVKNFYEVLKSKNVVHLVTEYFFMNVSIVEMLRNARQEFVVNV